MTELAKYEEPTSAIVTAAPAPTSGAARIREAAEVMALCKQLADAVANTNMMPKHLRGKPEETAAVMLYGATLDLDPMQSVRSIYEVHGQPGLYGRAMVGLVIGRGHKVWTVETGDDSVTVAGQRKGSANVEKATWTIERATKAGYVPTIDPDTGKYRLNKWGKLEGNEKYLTDPQSMLYAKAASEVCRKVAPDVLAGVYAVEDLQSEHWEAEVTHIERAPGGLAAALAAPTVSGAEGAPEESGNSVSEPATSAPESPLLNTSSRLAKAMYAGIHDAGIAEDQRLAFVSEVVGRDVGSTKELTEDEARKVLDHLPQQGEPEIPDPADGHDPWAKDADS